MITSGKYEKIQSGLKVWADSKRLTLSPGSRYGDAIERTLFHRFLLVACHPLVKGL